MSVCIGLKCGKCGQDTELIHKYWYCKSCSIWYPNSTINQTTVTTTERETPVTINVKENGRSVIYVNRTIVPYKLADFYEELQYLIEKFLE